MISDTEFEVIKTLREKGYAVVMFHPFELSGVDADIIEEKLVEYGWDTIDFLAEHKTEEVYND